MFEGSGAQIDNDFDALVLLVQGIGEAAHRDPRVIRRSSQLRSILARASAACW